MAITLNQHRKGITQTLIDTFSDEKEPKEGLSAFFPSKTTDTKFISIELERNSQKMAVYVQRCTDPNRNTFSKSTEKIFDNPIEIDCLVEWKEAESRANEFGIETTRALDVFIQSRALVDKNIEIVEGDFLSYGTQFFEITHIAGSRSIYGQVEHIDGIKLLCREARATQFVTKILGPTSSEYSDPEAVQTTFVQKRGHANNSEGATGDVRSLQQRGILDPPSKINEVSPRGDEGNGSSSFYDED